jgi:hypothetical protein
MRDGKSDYHSVNHQSRQQAEPYQVQMAVISPHSLNIMIKTVKAQIASETGYEAAINTMDDMLARSYDKAFFNDDMVDDIKDNLDIAILFLWTEVPHATLDYLANIRRMLDPIFVKNLWFANRLISPGRDIGVLGDLPDLVQMEIRTILYNYL